MGSWSQDCRLYDKQLFWAMWKRWRCQTKNLMPTEDSCFLTHDGTRIETPGVDAKDTIPINQLSKLNTFFFCLLLFSFPTLLLVPYQLVIGSREALRAPVKRWKRKCNA